MLVRGRAAHTGSWRNTVSETRLRALPAPALRRGLRQTFQVLETCAWLGRPHSLAQLFKNKLKTSKASAVAVEQHSGSRPLQLIENLVSPSD